MNAVIPAPVTTRCAARDKDMMLLGQACERKWGMATTAEP
jgi:hypothetical protein